MVGVSFLGQDRVVERFEKIPQQISSVTDSSTFKRLDVWRAAASIVREYPIFGIGFGAYYVGVSQFINISGQVVPFQAHNEYFEFAASGGMIAIVMAIWMLYRYVGAVRISFSRPSYSFPTFARNGAICAIAGVAVHSLFDFGLQLLPNQLFFAALVFISINIPGKELEKDPNSEDKKKPPVIKVAVIVLLMAVAAASGFFGYSRYSLSRTTTLSGPAGTEWYAIPFDPQFLAGESKFLMSAGDLGKATDSMRSAINYRPNDYELWLKLADVLDLAGQRGEVETAYVRAIELAPYYARPHYLFGIFLLKTGQTEHGLRELREASRRNPMYFPDVLAVAIKVRSGNINNAEAILRPFEPSERDLFAEYAIRQTDTATLPQSICGDSALSDTTRYSLVVFLIEKRRFDLADQLNRQSCTPGTPGVMDDSSFENRSVSLGRGFGWRFSTASDNTKAIVDGKAGERFLKIIFNGEESENQILSQVVLTEKGKRYRLSFEARSDHIVSGGPPVIQVMAEDPEGSRMLSEAKIPTDMADWGQFTLDFTTGKETGGVLVQLSRSTCLQMPCPIFGDLSLDKFSLVVID